MSNIEKYVGKYVIVMNNPYLCPTGRMRCTGISELSSDCLYLDDGHNTWVANVWDLTIDDDQSGDS